MDTFEMQAPLGTTSFALNPTSARRLGRCIALGRMRCLVFYLINRRGAVNRGDCLPRGSLVPRRERPSARVPDGNRARLCSPFATPRAVLLHRAVDVNRHELLLRGREPRELRQEPVAEGVVHRHQRVHHSLPHVGGWRVERLDESGDELGRGPHQRLRLHPGDDAPEAPHGRGTPSPHVRSERAHRRAGRQRLHHPFQRVTRAQRNLPAHPGRRPALC
mmetsp:Transcript_10547/g.47501  ORF Transcript_10547/g.47501 Transcript_10547/m.47501 type:complete len:219 (-) Transcript_10547:4232-4888(-)